MPSFKNIGLLAFFIGTTLASPTSHKEEKRQFLAPPPGCEDPAAFSTCASQSPIACLNPLPGSVAAWYDIHTFQGLSGTPLLD